MNNIMKKELKLSGHILSYLFILFGFMFFIPGYPILCGTFFVSLGIYQSFQYTRENNDILFSVLLPFSKKDVVKGKYYFVCFIELCAFTIMSIITIIRNTILVDSVVYRNNVMMNANGFTLSLALIIFGLFNVIFVGGFFKTCYKFGKAFVLFIIVAFLIIGIGETIHHIPGLALVNSFGLNDINIQLFYLLMGLIIYIICTIISCKKSITRFEKIDL